MESLFPIPPRRGYVRPSLASIRSFFLSVDERRPRNCYSILNMLEFIDNGHLVALFILVSMVFLGIVKVNLGYRNVNACVCKLFCVG